MGRMAASSSGRIASFGLTTLLLTSCGARTSDQADAGPLSDGAAPEAATDAMGLAPNTWVALAPLPGGPRQETGVAVLGGRIYVVGGFDRNSRIVATVEQYDPETNRWQTRKTLPMALHHANVAA